MSRGKPKGIARALAARKPELEKLKLSKYGMAATNPQFDLYRKLRQVAWQLKNPHHSDHNLKVRQKQIMDDATEKLLEAALQNDDRFFDHMAELARAEKALPVDGVDGIGRHVVYAVRTLKMKKETIGPTAVLKRIRKMFPDAPVYEVRTVRDAMEVLCGYKGAKRGVKES
jgi:hypothetical protein